MTPSEAASLMQEVVGVDEITPDDNFFDIGGNSFLAIELISAVMDRSGVRLSLLDFVRDPTADGISQLIKDVAA
jgi:acyl carrier protein